MEEVDHIYMLQKYPFVSKEELVEIQETQKYPTFCRTVYESIIRWHSDQRKKQSIMGREGMLTGPLVYLLSAQIQTLNFDDANKPITIFGRIHLEFSDVTCAKSIIVHELYGHSCDDPQILVGPSRSLALTSPDYTSETVLVCMSSNVPKLVVDVTVGGERFSGEKLCCTQVEQVKEEFFYGEFGGSLALRYISIPFAVYGRVEVKFIRKQDHSFDENGSHFIDVKGKVVARYCNTFGRFDSEECTLYDKEFERVTINDKRGMENVRITRPWIAVPIYSSLIIDLDLSECGTDRKLLKEKVQVPIDKWCGKKIIIDDEYVIALYVAWFYPVPQGRCAYDMMELEDESSNDNDDDDNDDEMSSNGSGSEECDDEHMSEGISGVASSPSRRLWFLHPHRTMPSSSPAMEVFSVFVGREQFEPFRVYGCIEVVSDAFKFQVFRKEADDALDLLHDGKILTLLDGPRVFDECCSLEIKVDLKDFENRLHIKGYVEWDQKDLGGSSWLEKQLCSVVQSNLGFAAIHYSFFPRAVQATIGIFCTAKKHGNDDNIYPEFYGSIVARYGSYDYTSQYNKDYYQIVIFQRNEGNRAQSQRDSDGLIPLSRSKVVVPLNSSLVIEANLHNNIFSQVLNDYVEFSVGIKNGKKMTLDGDGYSIEIGLHVKWDEVSE